MSRKKLPKLSRIFFSGVWLLFTACSTSPKTFTELLNDIQGKGAKQAQSEIRCFSQKHIFPFVEDSMAYFLFDDSTAQRVFLAGDFTGWKPDSLKMKRLANTSFWALGLTLPWNARVEYKFVADGKWRLDSLNPFKEQGGYGQNSVLMMPGYIFPKEALLNVKFRVSRLDTILFKSKQLHNKRRICIYHHPQAGPKSPLLIFNDGTDYLHFAAARIILDNLIGQNDIAPVNALFIDPVKREKEYWLNDRYLNMVFNELLPYLYEKYRWQPEALGFGGASLGGEIALYALKDYASRLDFVFSQSGALGIENGKLLDAMQTLHARKTKIYLSYGSFEHTKKEHKRLQTILRKASVPYRIDTFPEGHNWGNWRGHLKDVLLFFREH